MGITPPAALRIIDHVTGKGNAGRAQVVLNHGEWYVRRKTVVVLLLHGDPRDLQHRGIDHFIAPRPVDDIADGCANLFLFQIILIGYDGVGAISEFEQILVTHGIKIVLGRHRKGTKPGIFQRLAWAFVNLEIDAIRTGPVAEIELNVAPYLCQLHGAADIAPPAHVDSGIGGHQRWIIPRHDDFQHGDETQVAIGGLWVLVALVRRHTGSEGRVEHTLDLPIHVAGGPIQHVHGIGQMLRVLRAELKVNQHRPARARVLQSLKGEGERRVFIVRLIGATPRAEGREVNDIGHAVAVAITVKGIGDTVIVQIRAAGGRGELGRRRAEQIGTFHRVRQTVAVGIGIGGVKIPHLPIATLEALYLGLIGDTVAVRVVLIEFCTQPPLLQISERIAVIITLSIGDDVGDADGGLRKMRSLLDAPRVLRR